MSNNKEQDKWISVHDSLPQKTGLYKVKVLGDFECEVFMSKTLTGKLTWVTNHSNNITHWQPLPSPPKK